MTTEGLRTPSNRLRRSSLWFGEINRRIHLGGVHEHGGKGRKRALYAKTRAKRFGAVLYMLSMENDDW